MVRTMQLEFNFVEEGNLISLYNYTYSFTNDQLLKEAETFISIVKVSKNKNTSLFRN